MKSLSPISYQPKNFSRKNIGIDEITDRGEASVITAESSKLSSSEVEQSKLTFILKCFTWLTASFLVIGFLHFF